MIDIATHFQPPDVTDRIEALPNCPGPIVPARHDASPGLTKLDVRLRGLEESGWSDYRQVLSFYSFRPQLEEIASPRETAEICRFANTRMREIVAANPEWFAQALGMLPFNSADAASHEIDHIIELGFAGVQIPTDIAGKPLDHPAVLPIIEEAVGRGLVVFLHPARNPDVRDFSDEPGSEFGIWMVFGWPFATTAAMVHLAASGIFDRHPEAVFITHHLGGVVPYQAQRAQMWGKARPMNHRGGSDDAVRSQQTIDNYLPLFYGDSVLGENTAALSCGLEFFGPDRVLFGSDAGPDFSPDGLRTIRVAMDALGSLDLDDQIRAKITDGNAKRILGLKGSA